MRRCARTDNIHRIWYASQTMRQPVYTVCRDCAVLHTIVVCLMHLFCLIDLHFGIYWSEKWTETLVEGPVGFLANTNYKSTSRLRELVISLPQNTQIFLHMCHTFRKPLPGAYFMQTVTPSQCVPWPEVLLVKMSKKNISVTIKSSSSSSRQLQ